MQIKPTLLNKFYCISEVWIENYSAARTSPKDIPPPVIANTEPVLIKINRQLDAFVSHHSRTLRARLSSLQVVSKAGAYEGMWQGSGDEAHPSAAA
jgi:hypothetical protein